MLYKNISRLLCVSFLIITMNAYGSFWCCLGGATKTTVQKVDPKFKKKPLELAATAPEKVKAILRENPAIESNIHQNEFELGKFIDETFQARALSLILGYAQERGTTQVVIPAVPNSPIKTAIKSYGPNKCVIWRGDTVQVWHIADYRAKLLHVKGAQIPKYDKVSIRPLCDGRIVLGLESTLYSKHYIKYWHPQTQKFDSTLHPGALPLIVPLKKPNALFAGNDRYHATYANTPPECAASFPNGRVVCANQNAIVIHAPRSAGWNKQSIIYAQQLAIGGIAVVDDANFITWQTLAEQNAQRQPFVLDLWHPKGGKTFYARSPIRSAIATQSKCFAVCDLKKVAEFDVRDVDQSPLEDCETEKEIHSIAHLSPGQLALAHPDGSVSLYTQSTNLLKNALSRYTTQVKKQEVLQQIKKESVAIQALALRKAQTIAVKSTLVASKVRNEKTHHEKNNKVCMHYSHFV